MSITRELRYLAFLLLFIFFMSCNETKSDKKVKDKSESYVCIQNNIDIKSILDTFSVNYLRKNVETSQKNRIFILRIEFRINIKYLFLSFVPFEKENLVKFGQPIGWFIHNKDVFVVFDCMRRIYPIDTSYIANIEKKININKIPDLSHDKTIMIKYHKGTIDKRIFNLNISNEIFNNDSIFQIFAWDNYMLEKWIKKNQGFN